MCIMRCCCLCTIGKVSCAGYQMTQSKACFLCCLLLCIGGRCVMCSLLTVCSTAADSCRCISLQPRWSVCTFQQSRGTSCSCLESNRQSQQEDQTCCSLAVDVAAASTNTTAKISCFNVLAVSTAGRVCVWQCEVSDSVKSTLRATIQIEQDTT